MERLVAELRERVLIAQTTALGSVAAAWTASLALHTPRRPRERAANARSKLMPLDANFGPFLYSIGRTIHRDCRGRCGHRGARSARHRCGAARPADPSDKDLQVRRHHQQDVGGQGRSYRLRGTASGPGPWSHDPVGGDVETALTPHARVRARGASRLLRTLSGGTQTARVTSFSTRRARFCSAAPTGRGRVGAPHRRRRWWRARCRRCRPRPRRW